MNNIKLEESWLNELGDEFEKDYMIRLREFLVSEKKSGKKIYPSGELIFNALNTTPLERVKAVIIGQDPYHNPGQAHGLCFSVKPEVPVPPSLKNIYKELKRDTGFIPPEHGHLISWAEQGVLLLNAVLTVEERKAASHRNRGWETFTDRVIDIVNRKTENTVFLLWGSYAQKKGSFIDGERHLILKTTHPSPLSAHRGFTGCSHFSKTNLYLEKCGKGAIDWSLPERV